jgi:anaerobic selenocysteine-containing dehydrogenase
MSERVFVNLTNGGPVRVHVKDGRIVRVRPLVFSESDAASWTIDVNGRKFSPPRKACLASYTAAERARVYSDARIKYPLKRVDFDPGGNRHPETRGKSEYERISWDEALDLVAGEMKRIRTKYGPEAIMSRAASHHNWGNVGYRTGAWARFFNLIGFTDIFDNPDSWEGWHWGATHAYGFYWRLGLPEQYDLLEDALKNTDLVVHWGNDPDSTHGVYGPPVGGGYRRRSGAGYYRSGPGMGREADNAGGRCAWRRVRRLPAGLCHRVGESDGAPPGDAGPGQAGREYLGHDHGRAL